MSKGIRISEAAYLELRRRAESEKRTLQAVVDLLVEETRPREGRSSASRAMDGWLDEVRAKTTAKADEHSALSIEHSPPVVSVDELRGALHAKMKAETAATDLAASSEHGAPAAGRTDTSAAGCASTGVPPAGEPRSGGGEAAGTPGSSTTAAPPMKTPQTSLCGHPWGDHAGGAGVCALCECQSFVDLEQDLF